MSSISHKIFIKSYALVGEIFEKNASRRRHYDRPVRVIALGPVMGPNPIWQASSVRSSLAYKIKTPLKPGERVVTS